MTFLIASISEAGNWRSRIRSAMCRETVAKVVWKAEYVGKSVSFSGRSKAGGGGGLRFIVLGDMSCSFKVDMMYLMVNV